MDDLISEFTNIKVSLDADEFENLRNMYLSLCNKNIDKRQVFHLISNKVSFYFRKIDTKPESYPEDFQPYIEEIRELFISFLSMPDINIDQKLAIAERLFSRMIFFVQNYSDT